MAADTQRRLEAYLVGEASELPHDLSPSLHEQAMAARAFVVDDEALPAGLSPDLARSLCAALAARGNAQLLGRLAAEGDKVLAKAARRGLHGMRSRGARVAVPRPARRSATAPPRGDEVEELPSLASMASGHGERAVWHCQRDPRGGVIVTQALISETKGLGEIDRGHLSRKRWREMLRSLTARSEVTVATVSSDYAWWVIDEAYQLTAAGGGSVPSGYADARREIGAVAPSFAVHPALELWPEVAAADPREMLRLLDLPELATWMPEEEALHRVSLKLAEVDASRILVDERQKAQARGDVVEREADAYLDEAMARRLRQRLLDAAYLMHQRGGREDDARALRQGAEAFSPEAPTEGFSPEAVTEGFSPEAVTEAARLFVRRLFERLLEAAAQHAADQEHEHELEQESAHEASTGSGLIVSPYNVGPPAGPGRGRR